MLRNLLLARGRWIAGASPWVEPVEALPAYDSLARPRRIPIALRNQSLQQRIFWLIGLDPNFPLLFATSATGNLNDELLYAQEPESLGLGIQRRR